MKKILLASACIFALATPAAFAQTAQPTGGAASQGNAGTGAAKDGSHETGHHRYEQPPDPRPAMTPALPAQVPRRAQITRALPRNRVPWRRA